MKKKYFLFFLTFIFLGTILNSCKDYDNTPKPFMRQELRRLVIMYMVAENNLSAISSINLQDVLTGSKKIPTDCALAVYLDNATNDKPQILLFDSIHGKRTMLQYSTDPISTDSTTMQGTLCYITKNIKAKEYALILWSHGSGWLPSTNRRKKSFGVDNGHNTFSPTGKEMELSTLRKVLQNVGIHWEYIFYDACFMQCIEQAYELRDLTTWSIASSAEIPAEGAPYRTIMPYLFQATDYARDIPKHYRQAYKGVILSSIHSPSLSNLALATQQAIDTLHTMPTNGVQQYAAHTEETGWITELYDMASLMGKWMSPTHYAIWQQAFKQAVPYRFDASSWRTAFRSIDAYLWDNLHFSGVSMYVPVSGRDSLNARYYETRWYKDVFAHKAVTNSSVLVNK